MSKLGKRWEFDGVPAAFVTRSAVNGHYCITFEREEASLEQIEQINWSRPAIRRLTDRQDELAKPYTAPQGSRGLWQAGECCTLEGRVWQCKADNNAYGPLELAERWEDLGAVEDLQ